MTAVQLPPSPAPPKAKPSDTALLSRYAKTGDASAFHQLAARHSDWIYSVALRATGQAAVAEDVTQSVLILLAKKAQRLCKHPALSAWLFQTTRYGAATALRSERRRKEHERMHTSRSTGEAEPPAIVHWEDIQHRLDNAVARLPTADRQAILLRYYQRQTFPAVGTALGITEEAARKRITRALQRLRTLLAIDSPMEMLGSALSAAPIVLAPAHLATPLAAAPSAHLTIIGKGIVMMSLAAKVKIAAAVVVVLLLTASAVTVVVYATGKPATPLPPGAIAEKAGPDDPAGAEPARTALPVPYVLAEGEIFRYIPQPPADTRRRLLSSLQGVSDATYTPAHAMIEIERGLSQRFTASTDEKLTLSAVIEFCLHSYPQEVEGDGGEILIPGDILMRAGASQEELRGAIEKMLQGELHQKLSLAYRDVPRQVIVWSGTWKLSPADSPRTGKMGFPSIEIYEKEILTQPQGMNIGGYDVYSGLVGKYLHQQIVVECKSFPPTLGWYYDVDTQRPPTPQSRDAILNHIAEQTGLHWSEETRTVRRLFLEPVKSP